MLRRIVRAILYRYCGGCYYLLLVMLMGCGATHAPYSNTPVKAQGTQSELYSRAIIAVSDEGLTVASQDREAGLIATEWVADAPTPLNPGIRYRIQILLTDGSALVKIACEAMGAAGLTESAKWEACYSPGNKGTSFDGLWVGRATRIRAAIRATP